MDRGKIAIDLSEPYANGNYLLVLIDYYSRFPEVEIIRSSKSSTIINKLRKIFSVHGFCSELVTENGSNVISDEFKCYLAENGIKHTRVAPYWARTNGLVGNFNKCLKKAIRVATIERKNWKEDLYNFLLNYRATPHTTTGRTPSELLFNRIIKTKLPQVIKSHEYQKILRQEMHRENLNVNDTRTKTKVLWEINFV